ncbi:MAG: Calcineurin-like phosphoesterase superfamily domain, partial [Solirubrobacteraceae bacterium]|nr:Calcineurin-like phosphoesterase superfamily domain [Solirubrobacteraceae bacterium]
MATRRLIISDLHFGSGDDLLAGAAALERVEPELAWADELVINGDLFELVFASVEQAVAAARPFLALADRHVRRIHYIPGNHDHHLVSLARDERRFGDAVTAGAPPVAPGVPPAARLLRALCPTADVVTAYPACELDGMAFMHGHYIDAHARSSDRWPMNRLAWQLTGAARPERLASDDYEALVAPLYELMYEIANLPSGRLAQQRFERWLDGVAAIAHAPRHASQRLAALIHVASQDGGGRLLRAHDAPTAHVLEAMQAVCDDLDVRPRTIVFGHTHVALDGVCTPDGRHRLFNS